MTFVLASFPIVFVQLSRAIMTTLILASPEKFNNKFRRSFTVTEKIKVLDTLLKRTESNLSAVAREHCIDKSTLLRWAKQRDHLLKTHEKAATACRVSGGGRPSLICDQVKSGLLQFVESRRSSNLPVTARMLYYEWVKMDPGATELSETAARSRIYRFMKRNDLVYRRTTHHAQSSRSSAKVVEDWISYIQSTCELYGIPQDCIANFDETDVQFAVETKNTIAYRGERTVSVKKPDSSSRCTVMLGCAADGRKFPPYVIYKGKRNARVEKELRKWEDKGYSSGCLYKAQEKAWMNESVMLDWIERVWKPFAESKKEKGLFTMLIIDQMSAHIVPSVKKAVEDCGTLLEFIPKGYTSCLQVCDIGLNKPFKDYMRATVHEWMVFHGEVAVKPDRPTVSHWIDHAWNRTTAATIINTWAHIKLAEKGVAPLAPAELEVLIPGDFLPNEDPREEDVLALRDSIEPSSDEDE